jgi:hypothetical protein
MDEFVETPKLEKDDMKNILYYYLDKHPEDHEKIYQALSEHKLKEKMVTILEEYIPPVENTADGCTLCLKSWEDTVDAVKTTLLCGHTFHTACHMLYTYNNNERCPDNTCDIDSWRIVNRLNRGRREDRDTVQETIINNLQTRADFKADLKAFKKSINVVRSARLVVLKESQNQKKQLIHRNIHAMREIQRDMNETYSGLSKSENYMSMRSGVAKYRKLASSMFRKYHVSFRDLHNSKVIKADWRLRHILERHGSPFSKWRFNLRFMPGKKLWDDPII